jgi:hypothetical protein
VLVLAVDWGSPMEFFYESATGLQQTETVDDNKEMHWLLVSDTAVHLQKQ